jgi:hypothetical protein
MSTMFSYDYWKEEKEKDRIKELYAQFANDPEDEFRVKRAEEQFYHIQAFHKSAEVAKHPFTYMNLSSLNRVQVISTKNPTN